MPGTLGQAAPECPGMFRTNAPLQVPYTGAMKESFRACISISNAESLFAGVPQILMLACCMQAPAPPPVHPSMGLSPAALEDALR